MKRGLGMEDKEIGDVLTKWNKGVLDSFLIEITRDIMYFNDDDGTPLLEKILDSAGQKGTGKWTAINALDLGMPVTLIAEAVLSRCLSSIKAERTKASGILSFVGRTNTFEGNKEQFLEDLEQALYASKIISYAQGFMLMQEVYLPNTQITKRTDANFSAGCQRVQVEAQQAIYRSHVERRLHHPIRLPEGHHSRIPQQPGSREPALLRLLQQGHPQGPAGLERRCRQGCPSRHTHSGLFYRSVMVRRLPHQGPPRKPPPGPT